MQKIFFMILCICLSVSGANSAHSMSRTPPIPAENYYQGNPQTENATLYIYLCRRGCNPKEKGCSCQGCGGARAGLRLGFICVDESESEFVGIGDNTNNLIWSMFIQFEGGERTRCGCWHKGEITAKYFYNLDVYKKVENLNRYGEVEDCSYFLHLEDGSHCIKFDHGDKGIFDQGTNELSVSHILRTALFRIKYSSNTIPTISKLSSLMGLGCGITKDVGILGKMQVIPPYNIGGIMGYNCATFCRRCLAVLATITPSRKELTWGQTIFRFGVYSALGIVAPGIIVAFAFGAAGGVLFSMGDEVVANKPENVVDSILDFFQNAYEKAIKENDQRGSAAIDSFFSIIAHDKDKINSYYYRPSGLFNANDYHTFELKGISDGKNVRIGNVKGKIFFKEDFEPKEQGSCVML